MISVTVLGNACGLKFPPRRPRHSLVTEKTLVLPRLGSAWPCRQSLVGTRLLQDRRTPASLNDAQRELDRSCRFLADLLTSAPSEVEIPPSSSRRAPRRHMRGV